MWISWNDNSYGYSMPIAMVGHTSVRIFARAATFWEANGILVLVNGHDHTHVTCELWWIWDNSVWMRPIRFDADTYCQKLSAWQNEMHTWNIHHQISSRYSEAHSRHATCVWHIRIVLMWFMCAVNQSRKWANEYRLARRN